MRSCCALPTKLSFITSRALAASTPLSLPLPLLASAMATFSLTLRTPSLPRPCGSTDDLHASIDRIRTQQSHALAKLRSEQAERRELIEAVRALVTDAVMRTRHCTMLLHSPCSPLLTCPPPHLPSSSPPPLLSPFSLPPLLPLSPLHPSR